MGMAIAAVVWLNVIGALMLIVGLPTALLDIGMNGSRYAYWAPWGLLMASLGLVFSSVK